MWGNKESGNRGLRRSFRSSARRGSAAAAAAAVTRGFFVYTYSIVTRKRAPRLRTAARVQERVISRIRIWDPGRDIGHAYYRGPTSRCQLRLGPAPSVPKSESPEKLSLYSCRPDVNPPFPRDQHNHKNALLPPTDITLLFQSPIPSFAFRFAGNSSRFYYRLFQPFSQRNQLGICSNLFVSVYNNYMCTYKE